MVRQSVDRTGSSMAESKLRKSPAASANERGEPRSEQAYRYIVEAIKEGSLRPGTRIREVDLAERTGLSRTPVREAINQLAQASREVVEGTGGAFGGSPSIRSFIEARLHMTATLNARNFALRVHESAVQDTRLAHRLGRSIDIQQDTHPMGQPEAQGKKQPVHEL